MRQLVHTCSVHNAESPRKEVAGARRLKRSVVQLVDDRAVGSYPSGLGVQFGVLAEVAPLVTGDLEDQSDNQVVHNMIKKIQDDQFE